MGRHSKLRCIPVKWNRSYSIHESFVDVDDLDLMDDHHYCNYDLGLVAY